MEGKTSPPDPASGNRRSFLGALLSLGAILMGGLLSVPLLRFALFPLLRRTTELKESSLGTLADFSSLSDPVARTIQIEQVDGWRKMVSEQTVYVTRDARGELQALSSICPHLGCTVPWVSGKREFICPCHGAVYLPDGSRISGPSLRGMDCLKTSIEDGQLMVRFQYFRQLVAEKEVIG